MTIVTATTDHRFTADVLPCRLMKPVLAELAAERPDLRFVELDVDENPDATARYGVMSMPTFMVFSGGIPVARLVGPRVRRRPPGRAAPRRGAPRNG